MRPVNAANTTSDMTRGFISATKSPALVRRLRRAGPRVIWPGSVRWLVNDTQQTPRLDEGVLGSRCDQRKRDRSFVHCSVHILPGAIERAKAIAGGACAPGTISQVRSILALALSDAAQNVSAIPIGPSDLLPASCRKASATI